MIFCPRRTNKTSLFVFNVFLLKFLVTLVIRLLISFILCKIFNLVLVYFIAWPPVNQCSLTEGLPCLKNEKKCNSCFLCFTRSFLNNPNEYSISFCRVAARIYGPLVKMKHDSSYIAKGTPKVYT